MTFSYNPIYSLNVTNFPLRVCTIINTLHLKNHIRQKHAFGTKRSTRPNFILHFNTFIGLKINGFWVFKGKNRFYLGGNLGFSVRHHGILRCQHYLLLLFFLKSRIWRVHVPNFTVASQNEQFFHYLLRHVGFCDRETHRTWMKRSLKHIRHVIRHIPIEEPDHVLKQWKRFMWNKQKVDNCIVTNSCKISSDEGNSIRTSGLTQR